MHNNPMIPSDKKSSPLTPCFSVFRELKLATKKSQLGGSRRSLQPDVGPRIERSELSDSILTTFTFSVLRGSLFHSSRTHCMLKYIGFLTSFVLQTVNLSYPLMYSSRREVLITFLALYLQHFYFYIKSEDIY